MKRIILLLLLLCSIHFCFGQDKFNTYPKKLVTNVDSFSIRWNRDSPRRYHLPADSMNFNAGAIPGSFGVLYWGSDSIRIDYKNKVPYGQYTYFNIASPIGTSTIRVGFDQQDALFSRQYMKSNTGNAQFDIPEVYELANIIWTLSPTGARSNSLNKTGSYFEKVQAWFKPWINHPLFKALDFPDSTASQFYYEFRENSFAYSFKSPSNTKLVLAGPYYYVFGGDISENSLFGKLRPLVEDFAKKSRFRTFYKNNIAFYATQTERERQLLPVKKMWAWLENEFPKTRYQSYRIVFSPLIGGSHSTQGYISIDDTLLFRECVMFICNTDRVDSIATLTELQREGLMSGVVFTEIDHNYVNRVSNRYSKPVDSIMSIRQRWVKEGTANFYSSPMNVFNEYMTWAVFCLYVRDVYDKATADVVVDERETRMIEKRGFTRFREFNRALQQIHDEHKGEKIADLYPYIIEWCRHQQ